MLIKSVPIHRGPAALPYADRVYTLQEAINLGDCQMAHIHEGPLDPETGYPLYYDVEPDNHDNV